MSRVVIRDRPGEFISASLGPEGHKCSRIELMRMIAAALKDVKSGNAREIDLSI